MSPKEKKRLVLFDIDGTILWGGPLWKQSFVGALGMYFPNFQFPQISFGGKTDVQICHEMMQGCGFSDEQIKASMDQVIDEYVTRAENLLKTRRTEVQLLPGTKELLVRLNEHPEIELALLTGNVRKGAKMKLQAVDLDHLFNFEVSAFGDDHYDRYKLPPIAVKRALEKTGRNFTKKEIVIIGDTIHDVNCGKSIEVRSIAVGTGRVEHKELLQHNPDFFFADLSQISEVLSAILEDLEA